MCNAFITNPFTSHYESKSSADTHIKHTLRILIRLLKCHRKVHLVEYVSYFIIRMRNQPPQLRRKSHR